MSYTDKIMLELLSHNVAINGNMVSFFVKDWISFYLECCFVIIVERNRQLEGYLQISKNISDPKEFTDNTGHGPIFCLYRRSRNSTLFFVFQEMRKEPRNIQKPVRDFLEKGQKAQSKSQ